MARRTSSRCARACRAGAILATCLMAGTGAAQITPPDVRARVDSASLGTGYAQIIGLAATPDIAAAQYEIDSDTTRPKFDVFRLPYQAKWMALSPDSDLYWRIAGGYLRLKDDFSVTLAGRAPGSIDSTWTAYSASAGLLAKIRLGNGFTLEPALDVGVARLENSATYDGGAAALKPLLNGILFDWQTDAWLVTPSLALEWATNVGEAKATVRGHVARSWISSFDASDPAQSFNEAANVYSIRADYARPTGLVVADRAVDWVVYGGYAGFFGANRDALGFTSVAEVGGGVEAPFAADRPKGERLRLAAGYLFGPDVRGWTIGLSLEY
jgi:hypothetical protein